MVVSINKLGHAYFMVVISGYILEISILFIIKIGPPNTIKISDTIKFSNSVLNQTLEL